MRKIAKNKDSDGTNGSMSKGRSRLLSNFEVRHLSHTITEYVASVEGRPFVSRLWWQHIFLRHRIIFTLLVVLYLIGICTSMVRIDFVLAQKMPIDEPLSLMMNRLDGSGGWRRSSVPFSWLSMLLYCII